jgi:hypothetical protein
LPRGRDTAGRNKKLRQIKSSLPVLARMARLRNPSARSAGVNQKGNFLLPLEICEILDGKVKLNFTHNSRFIWVTAPLTFPPHDFFNKFSYRQF